MAFWVSLGIPVAVMGVFFLMPLFNMTINIISLLALIIVMGIIVDDQLLLQKTSLNLEKKGCLQLKHLLKEFTMYSNLLLRPF